MDISFWSDPVAIATLVLALVTAVLAGASFWTIRQNYNFRKKDNKQRLLDEIKEWALDIHKSSLEVHIPFIDMTRVRELEMQGYPTSDLPPENSNTLI
ncbi:MAG: hypothetical protein V1767_05225 [Chloroflexota bacterium]